MKAIDVIHKVAQAILSILLSAILLWVAWVSSTLFAHESRTSTLEATFKGIQKSLERVEKALGTLPPPRQGSP